ncbi:ornithine cyclodeaminase family protein [Chelativorans sp. SCAU2101]|uniref:Ornithine cyclodeaminase family protein n=1 Tax=Chelativorans petroleitrophicus TaxID=2975484 RepID=A0A9X2X7D2_9HYPH|nr:ornithine cyclodeaminase family protein [Chelativorans petroleitrophicus]MCT8989983.1 ornithine cyclodeaminase family protein [Chelativorans petroleitrophicus]
MIHISAEDIDRCLTHAGLVDILREAFRAGAVQPLRHHHTVERPQGSDVTLLLMPAWSDPSNGTGETYIGVKVVTVSPDNNTIGKPAIMGVYLLLDGATGEPRALIDGQRLTLWRTACASALAASYLAREDAERLLVVGAGALAPHLARAHASQRPIREIKIWNRTPANAEKVAEALRAEGYHASMAGNLDAAVSWADIVSCATLSSEPLVRGQFLRPGTHVDLVGAYAPTMREGDDAAISRSAVYVDTRAGATKEAGDIVQAIKSGALALQDIKADLFELSRGERPGRQSPDEITLFKSVGAAIEDLAAGIAVYKAFNGETGPH